MADGTSSSNTSIVAVLVIFLVVALGVGVFAFRGQLFGTGTPKKADKVDVTIDVKETPPSE